MSKELTVESLQEALKEFAKQKDFAMQPKFLIGHIRLRENVWEIYHALKGWIPYADA